MSVFDDPKKELEQLQSQLLDQEDWFQRELDSAKRMIGDMPESRTAKASVSRKPPVQPEDLNREEYAPRKKGMRGLLILATLELMGIAGIAAYWLLFILR